jgi:DNA-binding transcriptional LysR family regulator
MLNIRHLAVFRAVIKTGSVSAAARMLNVSQPAVTKTLQQVEDRIKIPLFRRIKGRLQPTPESVLLLPTIERVFGAVDEVHHLAEEIAGGSVGRIAIATVATLSASIAAAAVSKHRQKRPNVIIQLEALSTRQVVEEVSNNQVDVGIIDVAVGDDHLAFHELCVANIGCVMRRDHKLAGLAAIAPEMLRDEALITFAETTRVGLLLRERFRQLETPINIAITTNQALVACTLASNGTGIGLIDPFLLLADIFPNLTIVPLVPAVQLRPRIIFPPLRPLSIVAREFVETVKETANELVPRSALLSRA